MPVTQSSTGFLSLLVYMCVCLFFMGKSSLKQVTLRFSHFSLVIFFSHIITHVIFKNTVSERLTRIFKLYRTRKFRSPNIFDLLVYIWWKIKTVLLTDNCGMTKLRIITHLDVSCNISKLKKYQFKMQFGIRFGNQTEQKNLQDISIFNTKDG